MVPRLHKQCHVGRSRVLRPSLFFPYRRHTHQVVVTIQSCIPRYQRALFLRSPHDIAEVRKAISEFDRLYLPPWSSEQRFSEVRLTPGQVDEHAVGLQYSNDFVDFSFAVGHDGSWWVPRITASGHHGVHGPFVDRYI